MSRRYGYMATIGADTSGLRVALTELDAEARNISNELRSVNEGLRLDGGNGSIENLTRRYSLLQEAIRNTQARLDALRQAEEAVNRAAENGTITVEQQRQHQQAIRNTESQLRTYQQQLSNTNTRMQNLGDSTEEASQDTTQLGNQMQNAGRQAANFGDILKANVIGDIITNGIRRVCSELEELTKKSIELASNLTEVQNVVDTTFGNDAAEINRWSQSASGAFGLSELAAKKYTGTLGAMLKSQGITNDKIVEMSEGLVGLAGDMASFYNLDIETAFTKIRSGISGEIEPLKQLGINMNVANMEAYALANGIETSWKKMSQSEQTQLRYNYLLQQTADAQGDFIRTQDSYANQQRLMQLNMENLEAELGKKLLPIINQITTEVTSELPNMIENVENIGNVLAGITEFVIENKEAILSLAAGYGTFFATMKASTAISTFIGWLQKLDLAAQGATAAQNGLNAAASANPYVLLASAIAAVVVALGTYAIAAGKTNDELLSSAEDAQDAYEAQTQKLKELENELDGVNTKIEEIQKKGTLTLTDEEELENLKEYNVELTEQMRIEQQIYDLKKQLAAENSYTAIMSSDEKSEGSISFVQKKLATYKNDVEAANAMLEVWKTELDSALEKGDVKAAEAAQENIEFFTNSINTSKSALLDSLSTVNTLADNLDTTTENGLKAEEAVKALNDEILTLLGMPLPSEAAETDISQLEKTGARYAAEYKKQLSDRKAADERAAEEKKEAEEKLENDLAAIKDRYDRHKIVDKNENQDEAAYYAERKAYLEKYTGEQTAVWWKYYDEIASYETKTTEKAEKEAEELREKQQKEYVDAVKKQWDNISHLRKLDQIDEETEYKQKAQLVKKYCDENVEEYDEYYEWLFDFVTKKEEETRKEQVKSWEDSSKELSDNLEKQYKSLTERKEKVRKELLSIDLTETVKGKDGKDITVLTDLDAEIKKIDQYNNSLERLKKTNISDSLLEKIQGLDYESGERQTFINTLLGLSPAKLQLYYSDWEKMQAKAAQTAQNEINGDLEELNRETANAVSGIFANMPDSAYEEGVKTAQSYLQGIVTGMGDLNSVSDISGIIGYKPNGASSARSGEGGSASLDTPIVINLNDKETIRTTIGELMASNVRSGGNNYGL